MTGRGNWNERRMRVLQAPDQCEVEIVVTLSTSPAKLNPLSKEPFHVVVTAHNPLAQSVVFDSFKNCFQTLREGAYEDLQCTTSDKSIQSYPRHRSHLRCGWEDLDRSAMITVPANGTASRELELYEGWIKAAEIKSGERYRLRFTYPRMGCLFWAYGTLEDLNGIRLRRWRETDSVDEQDVHDEHHVDSPDVVEAAIRARGYQDAPTTMGEPPSHICLITESEIEIEVV